MTKTVDLITFFYKLFMVAFITSKLNDKPVTYLFISLSQQKLSPSVAKSVMLFFFFSINLSLSLSLVELVYASLHLMSLCSNAAEEQSFKHWFYKSVSFL